MPAGSIFLHEDMQFPPAFLSEESREMADGMYVELDSSDITSCCMIHRMHDFAKSQTECMTSDEQAWTLVSGLHTTGGATYFGSKYVAPPVVSMHG